MKKIEWDESLSVGIGLIDEQHKIWIRKLGDIRTAIESGMGGHKVSETLDFLLEYTESHFAAEEKIMAEKKYPGIGEHKARHAELKDTLDDLVREFKEEGATNVLSKALDTFLMNWLVRHIREVDSKLAGFLK